MASKTNLQDLYSISHDNYTTGSEWLDGLLIGLATWLLIRSSEFVIMDLLTLIFGNRKHRTGYRVLRVWQLLNLCHFHKLFTGFDSDIPSTRQKGKTERGFDRKVLSTLRVKKGRFMPRLVLFVLLGKLLILGSEVAIIAFVIPVATVHRSNGGLGLEWRNATVTEQSLAQLSTCERLLASGQLSDTAQLVLCKRVNTEEVIQQSPQKWIPNGSLRLELIDATPENIRRAGGVMESSTAVCKEADPNEREASARLYSSTNDRQISIESEPTVVFTNDLSLGEISISGDSILNVNKEYQRGSAAVLPVFSDAKRTLRLSFAEIHTQHEFFRTTKKVFTLNRKLVFGNGIASVGGSAEEELCRGAIDEIIRVTGTLHPELVIDIFRSAMTVYASSNFTEPSPALRFLRTTKGFEAGTSRRFRVPPEWMGLAAGLAIALSAFTSRLNKTEARMARVYREHNNMWSACAASYIEEETVVEGALFQSGNEYHWGEDPGKGWDQVSSIEWSEGAILV